MSFAEHTGIALCLSSWTHETWKSCSAQYRGQFRPQQGLECNGAARKQGWAEPDYYDLFVQQPALKDD